MVPDSVFLRVLPTNNEGVVFNQRSNPNKCLVACNGDWICSPFQCEFCWIQNLLKRNADVTLLSDQRLLTCLCRVNLDVFWSRASSTVGGVVSSLRKGLKMAQDLGIPPPYPPRGPWLLEDNVGFTVAL
eukprot:6935913-Ditylum_brightwellii.AAC.1